MTRRTRKKGMHPAVALVFLLVGGGFAAKSVLGSFGGTTPAGPQQAFSVELAADAGAEPGALGRDLLAVHGSYDRRSRVQLAFHRPADASPAQAPLAETAPAVHGDWDGAEPPRLRLGVVLVSEAARRASLGGRIVGVGDRFGEAAVHAIERGRVVVAWRGRRLTYELDDDVPVEFRAELARREAERKSAAVEPEGSSAPDGAPPQAQKQESGR
jgi:hypothetical protein